MRRLAWILLALLVAAGVGFALYRHFVTDQIMDGGDMTNPFLTQEEAAAPPENGETARLSCRPDAEATTADSAPKAERDKEDSNGII